MEESLTSLSVTTIARAAVADKGYRPFVVVSLCVAIIVICVGGLVYTRMRSLEYGYQIMEAEKANEDLTRQHTLLSLEVAQLSTAGRIIPVAREKLGLDYIKPHQVAQVSNP